MYLRLILVPAVLETTGLASCVSHEKQLTSDAVQSVVGALPKVIATMHEVAGLLLPPRAAAGMRS